MSLNRFIQVEVPAEQVAIFRAKSKEKIKAEGGWPGRNAELKAHNFVMAWTSEYSWRSLLDERGIRREWASTYVGAVEGAPLDFKLWFQGQMKTIGLRSRTMADLSKYLEVPYPDDRVRTKQWERVEDYTIAASLTFNDPGSATSRLYGAIEKERFIPILEKNYVWRSRNQQELFRPVSLSYFDFELMNKLLTTADRKETASL
ncbi:MAG: hypothetical protein JRM77_05330 [Nitrososphaerota archaeon]|nr:hypothetical protein [Nitrososphaerota archaeon]